MKSLLLSIGWVTGIIVCQSIGTWLMAMYLIFSAAVVLVYKIS